MVAQAGQGFSFNKSVSRPQCEINANPIRTRCGSSVAGKRACRRPHAALISIYQAPAIVQVRNQRRCREHCSQGAQQITLERRSRPGNTVHQAPQEAKVQAVARTRAKHAATRRLSYCLRQKKIDICAAVPTPAGCQRRCLSRVRVHHYARVDKGVSERLIRGVLRRVNQGWRLVSVAKTLSQGRRTFRRAPREA